MVDRKQPDHPRLPNATWRDIKQLGWAALMVVPMIVVVCYGAAGLVGARAAFWIGVGLAALTVVTFALIVVASLTASAGHDLVKRLRGGKRPHG
jgi:hypothetical protein